MESLQFFLENNQIDSSDLFEALHQDIIETILKAICDKLKKDSEYYLRVKKVFFSCDSTEATKKVVKSACGYTLSETDIIWLAKCFRAFFEKRNTRAASSLDEKKELLSKQNNRCAICRKELSLSDLHVDHIIPWDYVGDSLPNNKQALCSDCNLKKSNHVAVAVFNLVTHKRTEDK